MIRLNPSMLWFWTRATTLTDSLCFVVMTLIMVRFVLSFIFTLLNVSPVLSRGYYHYSCRLVFGPFMLISFRCCANIDLTRYHYVSPQSPLVPEANSTLINGLGRYAGGPNSSLAIVNVSPGKRYRFRLISISCDPNFVFSIDGHNMVGCLI